MTEQRLAYGREGEDAAVAWYEQAGYRIVDRNWRCREGELDIVATGDGVVVFCEVKARGSDRFGGPAEAVTWRKQRRIRGLAVRWLAEHDGRFGEIRFDVAAVRGRKVEIIEAAF
jgi:putative endonuclease